MQIMVTTYGDNELGDGWGWWSSVYVTRNGETKWIDSTGTRTRLAEAIADGWQLVLTDVALDPQVVDEVAHRP